MYIMNNFYVVCTVFHNELSQEIDQQIEVSDKPPFFFSL